ncbi:MAG: hypothetical protein AAF579_15880 [Cyanobacteria bacterium P01_C01_bin.118]
MTQEVPKDFATQINKWHLSAILLHSIYISLAITSVLSSVIVATFTQELGSFWTKVLAATSAAAVALIETTGVGRKGNGFRKAHRHLRIASVRFREDEFTISDLTRAFAEAEAMIGDVEIKIRDISTSPK